MMLSSQSWVRRIGGAGMLGLAALSGSAAQPPAQPPRVVHCKVLDEFPAAGDTQGVSHGTLVEAVLESRSMSDCERVPVSLGASMEEINRMQPGGLQDYVVQRFTVPTRETARALERIAQEQPPLVASQSQGASESRVVESLWGRARSNPEFRAFLERELELPAGTGDAEFLQTLVRKVDDIHHTDPSIRAARRQLLESANAAEQQGVVRVLSAGNQGELSRQFEELGVLVGRDFYLSDLAHPGAIIVGASDHKGTAELTDDGAAALASPDAGALIGAQGVRVPIRVNGQQQYHSGSSYAQPQIASVVMSYLAEEPGLSADQIAEKLVAQARPIPGAEAEIGAGIVDTGWLFGS